MLKMQLGIVQAGFLFHFHSSPDEWVVSLSLHSKQETDRTEREMAASSALSLSPLKPVGRSEAQPWRPDAASPCCANKSPFHFN